MVNDMLSNFALETYRLEDLVSDYCIANQAVKDILGIDLSKHLWSIIAHRKVNQAKYRLPELSSEQQQMFQSICNDLLLRYYPELM